ncbi:MAG: oxidoreductase [Sulfitobacter sp. SK025]|nr:MAG: oxidoreductase [Sulfitobacter sp. SK025]
MKFHRISNTIYALVGALAIASAANAGETLLDVSIGDQQHKYTLEDLQALPSTEFATTTIWTDGQQVFEGVLLKELLGKLDVTEGEIEATAINDYSVTLPVSDATVDGPIVAYLLNGSLMSRRGKGPLWIVYPYDSNPSYKTETIYSRSIWQMDRIAVK